jgi:hypothetical protein
MRQPATIATMNSDEPCLVPATADDVAEITDLYLAARSDALPYLPRLHTDEQVRTWIAGIVMRQYRVWVARRGGRVLGFMALDGDELHQLYLRPDAIGRASARGCLPWPSGKALGDCASTRSNATRAPEPSTRHTDFGPWISMTGRATRSLSPTYNTSGR